MVVTTFRLPRALGGGGGHESRSQAKQTETVFYGRLTPNSCALKEVEEGGSDGVEMERPLEQL